MRFFNFSKLSLRAKVLIMTESALLVLAVVSLLKVYQLKDKQLDLSGNSLKAYALNLGTPVGKAFKIKYNQIQSLSINTVFNSFDRANIQKVLNSYVAKNEGYDLIVFVDKDGNYVSSNSLNFDEENLNLSKIQNTNFSNQEWFQKSINEEFTDDEDKLLFGTYLGPVQLDEKLSEVTGKKWFGNSFSTVVRDKENEVVGVVTAYVNFAWVEDAFMDVYSSMISEGYKSAHLMMINKEGKTVINFHPESNNMKTVFLHSPDNIGVQLSEKSLPGFEDLQQGNSGFKEHIWGGHHNFIGYSSLKFDVVDSLGWGLAIRVKSGELLGTLERDVHLFFALVGGILVITMFIVFFFTNKIVDSITNMISKLKQRVDTSLETSDRLTSVSNDLSAGATEQAAAVQETVASMTEMTSMINQTATHVKESEELAKEVNGKTQEGFEIMSNMVQSMESIQQANEQLHSMTQIINEIAEKTKVINDIVFKTQLLSFNASIEAARAGQHGRGFAVVAEEVGNLAQMSGNAANEIADLINKSQQQVNEIVESTKVRVTEGQEVSGRAMETFNEIANEVEIIAQKVKSIQDATKEQEEGVQQVSITMKQIDETTQQNSSLANMALKHSDEVKEEAYKLEEIMNQVRSIVVGQKYAKQIIEDYEEEFVEEDNFEEEHIAISAEHEQLIHDVADKLKYSDETHDPDFITEEDLRDIDEDEISGDDESFQQVS